MSSKTELASVAAEAVAQSVAHTQPAAVLKAHPGSLPPAHWVQKQIPAQALQECQAVVHEAPSNPGSVKAAGLEAMVQVVVSCCRYGRYLQCELCPPTADASSSAAPVDPCDAFPGCAVGPHDQTR